MPIYETTCSASRRLAAREHKKKYLIEWSVDNPENFDHFIDQFWQWGHYNQSHWIERGVYNVLALQVFENPIVIELCCGDGFNAKHFYSSVADYVYSCDFDRKAISRAKKKNQTNNVFFDVADIRNSIPGRIKGKHITNIIWDTAIEHFTEKEIESIMVRIKRILSHEGGIVSGHTIVEREDGKKQLEQHEYEFKNMEDLKRFFSPYFKHVTVFETIHKDRHNLYFWASDRQIPFSKGWVHWTN